MSNKRFVIVITGAAGTGKTTISDYLMKRYGIPKVITHTTRPPRDHEQNGVDYYFETQQSFKQLHLLESVKYSGNYYGSSYEGLERAFVKSPIVSIVLDTKGAITYKDKLGSEAVVIFLRVKNPAELKQRVIDRGDTMAQIQVRMESKEDERDLTLPSALKGRSIVIDNEEWSQTRERIDQIVLNLRKQL